jgi:hypothetical protein
MPLLVRRRRCGGTRALEMSNAAIHQTGLLIGGQEVSTLGLTTVVARGAQIKEGAVGPLMVSNVNAKVPEGQDDQARLKVFKLMIAQTPHRVVQTQDRAHPVTKTAPTPTLPPRRWRRTLPRALGNKGTDPPRQRRVCLDSAVLVLAPDLLEQFCERSRLRHIALAAAFKSFGSSLTARLRWACRSLWRGTHRKE